MRLLSAPATRLPGTARDSKSALWRRPAAAAAYVYPIASAALHPSRDGIWLGSGRSPSPKTPAQPGGKRPGGLCVERHSAYNGWASTGQPLSTFSVHACKVTSALRGSGFAC